MVNRQYWRQKKGGQVRRELRFRRPVLTFLLITAFLLIVTHFSLDATIKRSMEYQGKVIASELLARETLNVLQEMELSYGDLVTISKASDGKIVSIETNTGKVNQLKNALEGNVTGALGRVESHAYSLPLGTLLGSEYLAGRGPAIPLRFTPMGYLESAVESRFLSAGINQTNHQLVLNLKLDLTTLVPLHRMVITVNTNVILAETVIVGEVPEYYTSITGETGSENSAAQGARMDPWDAAQIEKERK